MNFHAIPNFLVATLMFTVGLFVVLRNKKSRVHLLFFLSASSASIWQIGTALALLADNQIFALTATRIAFFGIALIPVFTYHLSLCISGANINKILIFGYLCAFLCFIPLSWTPLILNGVYTYTWGFFFKAGRMHPIFMVFFIYYMLLVFLNLFFSFKREINPLEKNRKKYLLIALFIAYIGSIDYLPTYGIKVYPFGYLTLICFVLIFAYAILRFQIMDINVALTRASIFIIVYTFISGIPFGIAGWGRNWLEGLLGQNWYWFPMSILVILATSGPFIYDSLRRKAENRLLKEQKRYQQAVTELSKFMAHILVLEEFLKTVSANIVEFVKVDFSAIYLNDQEYKSFRFKNCYPESYKSKFQEFISFDYPLVNMLREKKKPLLSEEIGPQDKIHLDSGLVIPCFGREGLLGFIILGAKPKNQMYTADDVLTFENFSYAASLAIERCIFWRELEERQRQARVAEMDLFSYSLAHEIDNPMNNIKTVATYLKDFFLKELSLSESKQKEARAGLEAILGSQERVSGMVKAIEEFGKPTAGEFGILRLEEAIATYLNLYLAIFKNHGIFFSKELPDKIPFLRGVKQEIMEVLANLSDNAIHALLDRKEKRISLRVEVPNQDFIRISLSDNGYGITEEKIRTIFAPFVTTKASTEGKGFGLYNCRRIIERHKGKIWAESEGKNKGATFNIELPIAKDVNEEDFKKEDRGKRLF